MPSECVGKYLFIYLFINQHKVENIIRRVYKIKLVLEVSKDKITNMTPKFQIK
jgi:uncharacterized protein YlbG (UPF0298 family)